MTFLPVFKLSIVDNRRCVRRLTVYFLSLLLCPLLSARAAPASEDAGASEQTTESALQRQILEEWQRLGGDDSAEVSFPALSSDLSLPDCPAGPEITYVRHLQPGRNGAEIRCSEPFWQQFIAFELLVYSEVMVLKEALPSDTELQPEHLLAVILDTSGMTQGYYTDPAQLTGMRTRRPLRTGAPLTPDMLRPVDLIERGQVVKVRLNKPGIHIVVEGTALSDGHAGEKIRVRNLNSGKTLYAEVISSSVVEIR